MDILFELMGEVLFGGILDMARSSKIPLWLRLLIIGLVVLFYGTIIIGLFVFSIVTRNWPILILDFLLFIVSIIWLANTVRKLTG